MDMKALYPLSYGLYAVGVKDDERDCGCIINTTFQINSVGPMIAISMNKENYTHELLERKKKFSISVLSEQVDANVIPSLGFISSKDNNKWENIEVMQYHELPVVKQGAISHLYCEVVSTLDADTHTIFLSKVVDSQVNNNEKAMTYEYYHNVVKGKAPKKAPTYQEEVVVADIPKWVCSVCGYVYDGSDFEQEAEDYTCPLCFVPKSHFELK